MNDTPHTPSTAGVGTDDKLDAHNREQLSALFDGELGSDQARFLLRRLQHDPELAACQERWQLLGDVLRGQACAPAPLDFSARVAAAVAAEPLPSAAPVRTARRGWRSWGGGAALAASVAAVALFMGRQALQEPDPGVDLPMQVIASQAELPAPAQSEPSSATAAEASQVLTSAAPVLAVAAASRAQQAQGARRASATRTQQAARSVQRDDEPLRAVANQAPLTPSVPAASQRALPFGDVGALQARPWPRSSLGPAAAETLNASAPVSSGAFYPFEPRLQESLPEPRQHD